MTDLLLIVRLAGERVAIPVPLVESVVDIEELTPVPGAAPHVAGLAALRSRVLTVIDCSVSLGGAPSHRDGIAEAIVVTLDGHPYALLVDRVEDVVEQASGLEKIRTSLSVGWSRVATSVADVEGSLLLVVDPTALIGGPTAEAA